MGDKILLVTAASRLGAAAPLGRRRSAAEIAAAAIWLISDAASYVTVALLNVSAGVDPRLQANPRAATRAHGWRP